MPIRKLNNFSSPTFSQNSATYLQFRVEFVAPFGVLQQQRRVHVVQRVVERRDRRVHHGGYEHVAVLGPDSIEIFFVSDFFSKKDCKCKFVSFAHGREFQAETIFLAETKDFFSIEVLPRFSGVTTSGRLLKNTSTLLSVDSAANALSRWILAP